MLKTIGILVAIIASVLSGYLFMDTHFAKCAEVKSLEKRLDYKIENDKLMGMQQRLWQQQEKFPVAIQAPMSTQKEIKELEADVDMQRNRVKQMEAK